MKAVKALSTMGRQRTMTRNSSIWNLFRRDRDMARDDLSQYEAETQQLEYFL